MSSTPILAVELQPRALRGTLPTPGVTFRVVRYSKHVIGGCLTAEIIATGTRAALAPLGDLLRCGLIIRHVPSKEIAWHGLIEQVQSQQSGVRFTWTLNTQTPNSVRIRYRDGDEEVLSGHVLNEDAQRDYGVIEAIRNKTFASRHEADVEALNIANDPHFGRPQPITGGYGAAEMSVRLLAMGRYQALEWRYALNPAGRVVVPVPFIDPLGGSEQFQQTSDGGDAAGVQDIGGTLANVRIAQGFHLGGTKDFQARTVTVYIKPTGVAAVDGVIVELRQGAAVATSTFLATGTIAPKYVKEANEHVAMQALLRESLNATTLKTVPLVRNIPYWLLLKRPNDANNVHRYEVPIQLATAPDGYPRGALWLFDGGTQTWAARNPAGYMPFIIGQDEPREVQTVGRTAADAMIGQPFTVSGWDLYQVTLRVRAVGQPKDGLYIQIRTVGAAPVAGVVVASRLIPLATGDDQRPVISDSLSEVVITFDRVALPAGVPLRLALLRENLMINADHYFEIEVDTSIGTTATSVDLWSTTTASWTPRPLPGVLGLTVTGVAETTEQIAYLVGQQPLITGVDVQVRSDRYEPQYRDGQSARALADVSDLLTRGTSSGQCLQAEVEPDGLLTITAQPTPEQQRLLIPSDERLATKPYLKDYLLEPNETAYPKALCPVGFWMDGGDVLPPGFAQLIGTEPLAFVEGAEVTVGEKGEIDYVPQLFTREDAYE